MAGWRKGFVVVVVSVLLTAMGLSALVALVDIPPGVVRLSPLPGAVDVDLRAAITVTFTEDIDPATIESSSLRLSASGVQVEANVSYDISTHSALLEFTADLESGTKYTATFDRFAGDKAGNTMEVGQSWSFTTRRDLEDGFGGPILIVRSHALPFSKYYSEILRAEGIGSFESKDLSEVTADLLDRFSLVLLGEMPLSERQVAMFSKWVGTGGDLISMRPDKKMGRLLGLHDQADYLSEGRLSIDTGKAPGKGIVGETIQYHGAADLYTLTDGTTEIARLYSDVSGFTTNPAITIRRVGTAGGQAAAFTFDLARSIIYTRQGNPAWAGDERDGNSIVRPNDLFFGAKDGDEQPDWIDLGRVAIPVADEQQRLLVNIMNFMLDGKSPLPRLWYFPKGQKAVLIMAGDDHGTRSGTEDSFERLMGNEPRACSVAKWECYRSTSWIYPSGGLSADEANAYVSKGFDIGDHVNKSCDNLQASNYAAAFSRDLYAFRVKYPDLPPQTGSRTHCLAWSDWAETPKTEARFGVRMDLSYYYWPGTWVRDRPGFMTGSGLPMRFADLDGSMIDVYQVASHLVNESGMQFPSAIETQLDRALGPLGYYGAFGTHYDFTDEFDKQLAAAAKVRRIPLVSVRQFLDWTDGRNNSYFAHIAWNRDELTFDALADTRTGSMLRGMLPSLSDGREVLAISREGLPVDYENQTIKGVTYAMFSVETGAYRVRYGSRELYEGTAGGLPLPIEEQQIENPQRSRVP